MFSKEYVRQFRLILRSKLNGRSKITAFNALAVFVMKYGSGILKQNTDKLKKLEEPESYDNVCRPKSNVDRIYLRREMER